MTRLSLQAVSVAGRLDGVVASFDAGTLTGLVGPNGSGKSTLLQAAAGVLPAEGEILWERRPLRDHSIMQRGRLASWVPQEARFEFGFTVRAVVGQGRFAFGDDDENVDAALQSLDLVALANRPVNQLSGGERQRVLLARALANGSALQLWDEPLAALDPRHALEVIKLARRHAESGGTLLLSLHDLRVANTLDRVIVLDGGKVRADGRPGDVFTPALLRDVFGVRSTVIPSLHLDLP